LAEPVQELPNSFEDKSVLSGVTTDAEAESAEADANEIAANLASQLDESQI